MHSRFSLSSKPSPISGEVAAPLPRSCVPPLFWGRARRCRHGRGQPPPFGEGRAAAAVVVRTLPLLGKGAPPGRLFWSVRCRNSCGLFRVRCLVGASRNALLAAQGLGRVPCCAQLRMGPRRGMQQRCRRGPPPPTASLRRLQPAARGVFLLYGTCVGAAGRAATAGAPPGTVVDVAVSVVTWDAVVTLAAGADEAAVGAAVVGGLATAGYPASPWLGDGVGGGPAVLCAWGDRHRGDRSRHSLHHH